MVNNVKMLAEIRAAPNVVAHQLEANAASVSRLAAAVLERQPSFAVTIARGTSDHAAAYLKYAFENHLGMVVSSANPSTTTLYKNALHWRGALAVAISQSGRSPDLVATLKAARAGGALTVALVNVEDSPLAQEAEFVLPLRAGLEEAVAATKTFIASLSAVLHWLEACKPDAALHAALHGLPLRLETALKLEAGIEAGVARYKDAETVIALARGLHHPMAMETALKLKETSVLHAESFSTAEFAHGPIILAEHGLPVIAFQARDATADSSAGLYREVIARGAEVTLIGEARGDVNPAWTLETPATGHALTDPLPNILTAYLLAGHLSLARGFNPDAPRQLNKVTMTL
jgi:glucosamine--fructose-6-phosphate aminotransferase (isomerizing)